MANRRIQRSKGLSDYLRAINEDVTKLNNRNHVTSIAANAIGSNEIGEEVILNNKAISSSDYLPGVSGWRIDGYGNSEFANVYVRGDINAYSGTIGYWNISQPLVTRTFGDYVIRGTLLESSDLGLTDDDVTSGTYVGLFKSYIDEQISVLSASRDSEIATITVADHNYSVGDYVKVRVIEDSSFDTDSSIIVDITDTTYKYYSPGSDTTIDQASGYSILDIRDIAGLYLRDYSKSEFDYGYFSNTGVAYVSAEDINLIENPSFEYIDSGKTPVSSSSSWTAGVGVTFALEHFNDATDPQYQYDSSYGGSVSWSSSLSTYLTGTVDYLVGNSYNIFKSGRVLYLGMTMFPLYTATRAVPTAVGRYNSSGSLYWRVDTSTAHGLSGGDTALLDFEGYTYDSTYGENIDFIPRNVTGGVTRTYTVASSPAPTSTRFYVDSGYSFSATMGDGVTPIYIANISPVNTHTVDFGTDAYGTRPGAYVYKVINAAFNLSEIRFRFSNGSTVAISDVASIATKSSWETQSNKYLISDPTLYALGYNDASIGIPYMYKSIQTIIDANSFDSTYKSLDSTGYAAGTDVYIDIPAWAYYHDGAGYLGASPTKISSFTYIVDNLYMSTTTKSFFGGSLANVRWYSSTDETPSYDPAQASIEGTKQWLDINLDTQTAYLDYFNYLGLKQSNFSRSMLVSPNITTSDSISAKVVIPTDYETLTFTSGIYRYINNGGDYIDLSSSLKTITGDRDTGFELTAGKKYHTGVSDTIFAEEYALIAGYWDESASSSVVQIKSKKFIVSGGGTTDVNTDRLTIDYNGVVISGNLTVNGTTTTVNSTTITVDDKNIELASTASPSDALADGAGITVKGGTDKTWNWVDATDSWTSNQSIDIVSTGTAYNIAGTSVLNATTLGSGVVNSSLTKVGALSGGTAGFVKTDASGNLTSVTTASVNPTTTKGDLIYASATGTPGTLARLAVPATNGYVLTYNSTSGLPEWAAASGGGSGTVTSVGMSVPTGLSVTPSSITTSGTFAVTYSSGYAIPTTASQTNWDSAYTDRLKWDGGSTGLVASTGRTSLGATTVGSNLFTLTNPTAITFLRINADNTVSTLDASTFRTAIGAGTSSTTGTVTSVGLSLPTGLSVTPSSITTSGTFTISYSAGYAIPTTSDVANGVTAYGWGNHASAGYLTTSVAASTYQPLDTDLTAIAALTGSSGFLKTNGAGTWSVDTATYLTSLGVGSSTQAWDADLDAISAISTTGILKRTGTNTWATITDNSTNWDTAFGWGNHASAGYLTTRPYVGQTQTTASGTNMAITGITSITGPTGTTAIDLNSAATTSAASGAINVITGTTTTSGTTGAVTLRSGNSAAASGAVTVSTGTSVGATSGILTLSTGSLSSGAGNSGALSIATGAAGSTGNSGAITMDVGTKTTGTFGTITIGGTNASAVTVGNVTNTTTATIAASTTLNLNVPTIATNVTSGTLALFNTGLTGTLNFAGAATAINIGATTGTLTLNNPTIATSVTSGTLALFNTGLTGTLSIGGAAGTINIGASTTTKAINIGTATTTGNSSTIRIGTAQAATTSDIYLQGAIYVGKDVSGTGNQTGYSTTIVATGVVATGATGDATAGSLSITSGGASLSNISNPGTATSGNITMDVGSSTTTGGTPLYGTITIGQFNASAVNIGRSGVTTTINGSIVANTAATSTTSQLRLVTGTVPTTASQQFGMISADAESIQLATTKTTGAGAGFGFIRAPQMVYAIANSGAATTSTPVSPFASTNDVLSSLEVNKYYRFRGVYYVTSTFTSGTATIQLAFAFSNAPVTFKYNYKTHKSTGVTAFDLAGISTTNAATTVSAAVTATATYAIQFEGFFTSNATTASTLTPQFQMSTTGSSTIATIGSFFEIEKLNSTGATTPGLIAGNWA